MKALITVTGDANGGVVTPYVSKKYLREGYLDLVELARDGCDLYLFGDMVNYRMGHVVMAKSVTMLGVTMRYKWQHHGLISNVPIVTVCYKGWFESAWVWLWS